MSSDVGKNADNTAAPGKTASYTVYMDPALGYGAHVFHSTGDTRQLQGHGLFGVLVVRAARIAVAGPAHAMQPLASGWDATIQMPSGAPSFREFNLIFHEIGDEGYRQIMEAAGATCDTDRVTGPGVPGRVRASRGGQVHRRLPAVQQGDQLPQRVLLRA